MALRETIPVPTYDGVINLEAIALSSIVFIGANGAGKTRLGVFIDQYLSRSGVNVHRVAAHRSLSLNPDIIPPSLEVAKKRLLYGYDQGNHNHKHGSRYSGKPETILLNDFDHLVSALYAENNDVSVAFRQDCFDNLALRSCPPTTKIDLLKSIWETVLPHRKLVILSNNFKTKTVDGNEYSASEMSDGERVIFYLIGQALIAEKDTLLIFDEPELHINRSILVRLWDSIESSRPDCSFFYITHDVEFAASRHAATKYALRNYRKTPNESWDIQVIPEQSDLPDGIIASIVGSRRPILFVEGDGDSLDASLYRRVYKGFTIIPVGTCDRVIHIVTSFAGRPELHRIGCAGIVDADGRTNSEAAYLQTLGVYRLPVSEVENLLLLPDVFIALAKALKFEEQDAIQRLENLKSVVLQLARNQTDEISMRYTRRRIDAETKKIGLKAENIDMLEQEFQNLTGAIDIRAIFREVQATLITLIRQENYPEILLYYDNKGLLAEAAKQLGYKQKPLEEFVGRALRADNTPELHVALSRYLPSITPRPQIL